MDSAWNIVLNRALNRCEKCNRRLGRSRHGKPDGKNVRSVHHRTPQRHGGKDSVENLVVLCITCHRDIHKDEDSAARTGWIVIGRDVRNAPFESRCGWVVPLASGDLLRLDWASGHTETLSAYPEAASASGPPSVKDRAPRVYRTTGPKRKRNLGPIRA